MRILRCSLNQENSRMQKYRNAYLLALCFLIGFLLYLLPRPEGISSQGWRLLSIFIATVVGVILKPLPMAVIALLGLTASVITQTLTFEQAFSGFSNEIAWLIVLAFFVARGFILTGLGSRLAYKVMSLLGKNSLGLGYGLIATDVILAPTVPSMTARSGGVVYPILKGLAEVFSGPSHDPKMGAFLTLATFQGCTISSALFFTSMAGNPLIAQLALAQGVEITWGSWALASLVPGLISLLVIPYLVYRIAPPTIRKTPHAKEMAENRLAQMGPMKWSEWMMCAIFFLLIALWIAGPWIKMKATVAAMIGVSILFISGILKWKDALEEYGAWDTFIWFPILITLASFLNEFGLTTFFSQWVVSHLGGLNWGIAFFLICLLYFYSHYFFASNVAHISAMYAPLLVVSIALGTPPGLAALTLAFFSNLFGGLTHYGSGPAPILFGTGYVTVQQWWRVGFLVSLANIAIWLLLGGLWWKVLGIW